MSKKLHGTACNLLRVAMLADPIDWACGLQYYPQLRSVLVAIAQRYHRPAAPVVAAFVSLSPNNDYFKTLRSLVTLLYGAQQQRPVHRLTVSTYNACKHRAWMYLHGTDFLSHSRGPKIRAFYNCILTDDTSEIVVDGHMVSAWAARHLTMVQVATRGFDYIQCSQDIELTARCLQVTPQQAQAVIWLTWKRLHRVLVPGTLDLWGDHWQMQRSAALKI